MRSHLFNKFAIFGSLTQILEFVKVVVGNAHPTLTDSIAMPLAPPSTNALQIFHDRPDIEESPAWEFVESQAKRKPMPTIFHSILQKRLTAEIDRLESDYEAFPELRCVLDRHSIVPDVTVVRRDRLPIDNKPIDGAPDWAIEILSPEQSTTKLISKLQLCLRSGMELGWIIDPTERVVMVLRDRDRLLLQQGEERLVTLEALKLEVTANQIFAWLDR